MAAEAYGGVIIRGADKIPLGGRQDNVGCGMLDQSGLRVDEMHVQTGQVLASENLIPRALLPIKSPVGEFAARRRFHQQIYEFIQPRNPDGYIHLDATAILRLQPLVELGFYFQKFG